MGPLIGSGLVAAGASVLGNMFNWWQNDEQREYERQQQDRQWRMALDQWNRENQYNLPSAQMERLRAAGINPHLAFANGDVMNEGASSPSVPQAHQVQPYTVNPLEASAIALQAAEADKASAEAEAIRGYKRTQAEQEVNNLKKQIEVYNQSIAESKAKVDLMSAEEKERLANAAAIDFRSWLDGIEHRGRMSKMGAEVYKLMSEGDEAFSRKKLNDRELKEMIETFTYRLTGLKLNNQLSQQQINEYTAMWKSVGIEFDSNGKASVIPDSPLDKQLSKYGRHTPIYSYLEDLFGLAGMVFGANAGIGVSFKPGKKD